MKIGILTFYCSDNYGAMLQAYGLKNFVQKINSDVEIVPYAPYYLVGRHWFIPYYPFKSIRERVMWTLVGIKHNLQMKGANSRFLRTAGPHFPDSPGHIKRTAWDISRAEGTPPH